MRLRSAGLAVPSTGSDLRFGRLLDVAQRAQEVLEHQPEPGPSTTSVGPPAAEPEQGGGRTQSRESLLLRASQGVPLTGPERDWMVKYCGPVAQLPTVGLVRASSDRTGHARDKYGQPVLPVDARLYGTATQPLPQPEQAVLIGEQKIRDLSKMVKDKLDSRAAAQGGRSPGVGYADLLGLDAVGLEIHNAVMNYFSAGLKSGLRVSASGPSWRDGVYLATANKLLSHYRGESHEKERRLIQLAFGASGGNEAYVCAAIAKVLDQPHAVVVLGDQHANPPVFQHPVLMLAPRRLDVADGPEPGSVPAPIETWVFVDPFMKIVCRGDSYVSKCEERVEHWKEHRKFLLHPERLLGIPPRHDVGGTLMMPGARLVDPSFLYPRDLGVLVPQVPQEHERYGPVEAGLQAARLQRALNDLAEFAARVRAG